MKNLVKAMALVGLGGTGCGDKSPADKCEDLVSLTCDRVVECIAGASGMHDSCVEAFHRVSSCSTTKSIGPGYDDCMDMLNEQSCGTLFSMGEGSAVSVIHLPPACFGVLSTQAVRGEPGPVLRMPTQPVSLLGSLAIQARAGLE